MFRRSALIVIAVVAVLVGAVLILARNGILERLVEHSLESMVQAKVEIDDLNLDLAHLGVSFRRMQVADRNDPWHNVADLGPSRLSVALMPLFAGKLVVDEMSVTGLRFDTKRSTSGALAAPTAKPAPAPTGPQEGGANLDALKQKLDLGKLVDPDKLASVRRYRQAEADAKALQDKWQQRLAAAGIEEEAKRLETEAKALETADTSTVVKLAEALKRAGQLRDDAGRLVDKTKQLRSELGADIEALKKEAAAADRLRRDDAAAIAKVSAGGGIDFRQAGRVLFGAAVSDKIDKVLGYLERARTYLPAGEAGEDTPPPRHRGQDISFPITGPMLPRLVIRKMLFSGTLADGAGFSGSVRDIASSARFYGKPVLVDASVAGATQTAWTLHAVLDHRAAPVDTVALLGKDLRVKTIGLGGDGAYLPTALEPDRTDADLQLTLRGARLNGRLKVAAAHAGFRFSQTEGLPSAARELRPAFANAPEVSFTATIGGTLTEPSLGLTSNLDTLIGGRVNDLVAARQREAQQQIQAAVDKAVATERGAFEQRLQATQAPLQQQVDTLKGKAEAAQKRVDEQRQALQAKVDAKKRELDQALKKKQDELKKKLQDALKH